MHFIDSIKAQHPTDKTAWDDDDDNFKLPLKKSTWDFPTPDIHGGREPSSDRFDKSRHDFKGYRKPLKDYKGRPYDDTPRATPAHK